jgi:hypothetical protein
MQSFVDKLDEQNLINVMQANQKLEYEPVRNLIAYKLSKHIDDDMKTLEDVFSKYV